MINTFRGDVTAPQHSTSALSHRVVHSTEKPSLLHLASKNKSFDPNLNREQKQQKSPACFEKIKK
jgi:hypothetical protein